MKNTSISEYDIFRFVFFQESLSAEEIKYIRDNEDKFEQLKFYRNQKKSISGGISLKTKEKIAASIPAYKIT